MEVQSIWRNTAQLLKGSSRRTFMADVVRSLGRGGQRFAEKRLGWNRKTIRKGMQERDSGQPIQDRFQDRGRKKAEKHLPSLLEHIRCRLPR